MEPPEPLASGYLDNPVTEAVRGINYTVELEACTIVFGCDARLKESAIWGKKATARALAVAVGRELGSDNATGAGPAFVYGADDGSGYAAFGIRNGSVTEFRVAPDQPLTVAHVEAPEPATPLANGFLPEPATEAVRGVDYTVELETCAPLSGCEARLKESAVRGKKATARALAVAVGRELGSDNATGAGPAFVYGADDGSGYAAFGIRNGSVTEFRVERSASLTVAHVEAPEPATPLASGFLPEPAIEAVGGVNYTIELETCATVAACDSWLRETALWGNKELARKLPHAVGGKLGSDNATGAGPAFVYGADEGGGYAAFGIRNGSVTEFRAGRSFSLTAARVEADFTEPLSSPSPAPASSSSPSPSPRVAQPPVCTGRAVSVATIDAQFNFQLCRLRKLATRKSNPVAVGTVVTAVSFNDPAGNAASITFTGATANRMAAASCRCSRAQRSAGGCACVPDAVISQDRTSVRLMPLLRGVDAARREAATTVRLFFNATVPATGLSCSGAVDICSQRLTRSGAPVRRAPGCSVYGATRAVRDLTVCSG